VLRTDRNGLKRTVGGDDDGQKNGDIKRVLLRKSYRGQVDRKYLPAAMDEETIDIQNKGNGDENK